MLEALPVVLSILTPVALFIKWVSTVLRDLRQNDERIGNRDEDLRTWIEDDREQARRAICSIHLIEARRADDGPDYSVSQVQRVKEEVVHRYRDQLRDAERVVREVKLSEQLPHRVARRITKRSVPGLSAPAEKADVITYWETSAEDEMASAKRLRALSERRRAEAGKPPLRPLRLAEIV